MIIPTPSKPIVNRGTLVNEQINQFHLVDLELIVDCSYPLDTMRLQLPQTIEECENVHIKIVDDIEDSASCVNLHISDKSREGWSHSRKTNRTFEFFHNLINTKAFQDQAHRVTLIELNSLWLDDWEHFLQMLPEFGATVRELKLSQCYLSERGALVLGTVLQQAKRNPNGGYLIDSLKLSSLKGSNQWIDGLLQNKTIWDLECENIPFLNGIIQFIQNASQLRRVKLSQLKIEEETEGEGDKRQEELCLDLKPEKCLKLLILRIDFHSRQTIPPDLCQKLGQILGRAANLRELSLCDSKKQLTAPRDLLKNMVGCTKLSLSKVDFDPEIVASLIRGKQEGGNLKVLNLYYIDDQSSIVKLFKLVDLSLLASLRLVCRKDDPDMLAALLSQINQNKVPKHLSVSMADLDPIAVKLTTSLIANNQIEDLEIGANSCREESKLQFLVEVLCQMPQLRSWRLGVTDWISRRKPHPHMREMWKMLIERHTRWSWNIHEVYPPFTLGNKINQMLLENKRWQKLFRNESRLSDGIWARALGRIKVGNFDLMFRVIQEVPTLFQHAWTGRVGSPSFLVPHHIDCPGCYKRRKRFEEFFIVKEKK